MRLLVLLSILAILAFAFRSSPAHAADCSLGAAATLNVQSSGMASVGCEWRSIETRLYYVSGSERTRFIPPLFFPGWGGGFDRYVTDPYAGLSIMKVFRLQVRGFELMAAGGAFFKEDQDGKHIPCGVDRSGPVPTRCFRVNDYIPRPVSFSFGLGVVRDSWGLRYGHVSNGRRGGWNLGLDFLQLEYAW